MKLFTMPGLKAWISGAKSDKCLSTDGSILQTQRPDPAAYREVARGQGTKGIASAATVTPRKRARLGDVVQIKVEEDEDEIFPTEILRPPAAKRRRLIGGKQGNTSMNISPSKLPTPPSSKLREKAVSNFINQQTVSLVCPLDETPLTPKSAAPTERNGARSSSSPTEAKSAARADADHSEEEESIRDSIEDDMEYEKHSSDPRLRQLHDIVKHKRLGLSHAAKHDNDEELSVSNDPQYSDYETSVGLELSDDDDIPASTKGRSLKGTSSKSDEGSTTSEQGESTKSASSAEFAPEMEDSAESEQGNIKPETNTNWREEQILLNGILNALDKYTLMPSTWAMHFRGIPLPPDLFYHKVNKVSSRPRVYAHTDKYEFRGALHLRKIADVQARIRDLRETQRKISKDRSKAKEAQRAEQSAITQEILKKLRHVLEETVHWSRQDGGLGKFGDALLPNILVIEKLHEATTSDELLQPMHDLAEQWRARMTQLVSKLASKSSTDHSPQAPVIYGLLVINHLLYIVSIDASNPQASVGSVNLLLKTNMGEQKQQQWNALAIMVTVCWARDKLMATAQEMKLDERDKETESDPDA
ncbi:uncharacterized protein BCR38DRAFT_474037 [Pseudomassariella vexata]|uniref:Uncharacterized protein n=1 Tax=Pseudomassariella vexata TaxID=1141098 RepID=A0A1Y2E0J6_9PEZI|nr:uncharacterized protein BCR38DRAFT_474037 [Pseudomassariella vexata]ORY65063.1 hypothetical protein BCR38DRAFT_474037 [Pseudomassariella vexata]